MRFLGLSVCYGGEQRCSRQLQKTADFPKRARPQNHVGTAISHPMGKVFHMCSSDRDIEGPIKAVPFAMMTRLAHAAFGCFSPCRLHRAGSTSGS